MAQCDMKMVNGRVRARTVDAASQVLQSNGLTISAFIRNSLEYMAESGKVPQSGFSRDGRKPDMENLKKLMKKLEAQAMPGRADYSGLSEDQMIERIKMERYGY